MPGLMGDANKPMHGLYSCKQRVPKAMDQWGKPVTFNCTVAPFYEPPRAARDCYKGKQIITKSHLPHFSKLTYEAEPYEDSNPKIGEKKNGFGTSKPLAVNDLATTIQTARFRHHLELEARMAKHHADKSPPASPTGNTARKLADTALLRETQGLASVLPKFSNEYDRQRFVPEFSTRNLPPEVRSTRIHGSTKPTSFDIGEGAFDPTILKSPAQGVKKPGTSSIVHELPPFLSPTTVGR